MYGQKISVNSFFWSLRISIKKPPAGAAVSRGRYNRVGLNFTGIFSPAHPRWACLPNAGARQTVRPGWGLLGTQVQIKAALLHGL